MKTITHLGFTKRGNWNRMLVVILASSVLFITHATAATVVVSSTNVSWTPGGLSSDPGRPRANYISTIYQDVGQTDGTGALFYYNGTTIEGSTETLDEGSGWYLASPGVELSLASIAANAVTPIMTVGPTYYPAVTIGSTDDVYLGIVTSRASPRNIFGWIQLRPIDGVLTPIANAMSYDSPGIYVGTTTVVPEPTAFGMVAATIAALSRRRRRVAL